MKCRKRLFAVVYVLFALLLSLSTGTLSARDADLASLDLAGRDHCPDVSATFTTIAFDDSSLRWLGISDLIAEPEGPSFISRTVAYRRVDRRYS